MRLSRVTLSRAGQVIQPIDPHKTFMGALSILYGNSTINATGQVDGTVSDLGNLIPVTISRATTTVTVTFPSGNPHTLGGTSDYIVISGTGVSSLDGVFPLASVTNDTVLTYTSGTSGTTTAKGFAVPVRFAKTVIASGAISATAPAVCAVSATTQYIPELPFSGLILKCTSYTDGTLYLDTRQAGIV